MSDIKMEDIVEQTDLTSEPAEIEETIEQDPLKTELEKVQKIAGRSELEKAQFSLKKNAERLKELGGDPTSILGVQDIIEDSNDDDAPVTMGMLKKMQMESATKTAKQLADEISDETERELVKYYLENRVVPSGNPKQDLEDARGIVNAKKNAQILEEVARKTTARTHSNSTSAPLKSEPEQPDLTKEEMQFMRPPFNMTKEQILKTRK